MAYDHEVLFPDYDEYEITTFDYGDHSEPRSDSQSSFPLYGKPYGGYARATASRLAKLPLKFSSDVGFKLSSGPASNGDKEKVEGNSSNNVTGVAGHYFTMRDANGRLFACSAYKEDSLEIVDVHSSMFNIVQYPPQPEYGEDDEVEEDEEEDEFSNLSEEERLSLYRTAIPSAVDYWNDQNGNIDELMFAGESMPKPVIFTIERLSSLLNDSKDKCSTVNQGWWNYKWCFRDKIEQFHQEVIEDGSREVNEEKKIDGTVEQIEIEVENPDGKLARATQRKNLISLGNFVEEYLHLEEKEVRGSDISGLWSSLELHQKFENGDICDLTGRPRETTVKIMCCPQDVQHFSTHHSMELKYKVQTFVEMPKDSCKYTASVCSPTMCAQSIMTSYTDPVGGDESINEILDRAMKSTCLVRDTGWWKYEFCHKLHVRQFHPKTINVSKSGKPQVVIDKQHTLGLYIQNLDDNEDEIRQLVKVDLPNSSSSSDSLRTKKGLAFLQEYKSGDLCVGKDVDDTVIKGGVVGSETIERSASVRYFCGTSFGIADVSEDHTCHYVIDVSVPDLCTHSLFRTQKKEGQVVKCLPVN
eukprot:CAMPEP_0196813612 /NCGR_PEP_ID=MMETSP1362-20130617/37897_1 /TAXON_ID=163516 /ORGANISM="Leptocylindrus danicus, Strain CCMP1856" /LENGTH=584 /DNA_ID=CAMNT_0042189929 /DNA_START=52 /DNA_END=1806 /DNA_ORIENTATION=+